MIKKFKEYISESIIISEEELEDQFLRLKEVFNCVIEYDFENSNIHIQLYPLTWYLNHIQRDYHLSNLSFFKDALEHTNNWTGNDNLKYDINVEEEINNLIKRFEQIYPDLKLFHTKVDEGGMRAFKIEKIVKKVNESKENLLKIMDKKLDVNETDRSESIEELEDQFLRLKEIFGCSITIDRLYGDVDEKNTNNYRERFWVRPVIGVEVRVSTFPILSKPTYKNKNIHKLEKELENVKKRIESIYSPVKVSYKKNGWIFVFEIIPQNIKEINESIRDLIKWEDVDDEFLRIKDLYGYNISCYHHDSAIRGIYDLNGKKTGEITMPEKYTICIRPEEIKGSNRPRIYYENPNKDKIEGELEQIKKRMELMFPGILMTWKSLDLGNFSNFDPFEDDDSNLEREWTVSIVRN